MEEQVVIECLNLMGKTSVEFDDLKVKMTPHSFPQRINRVCLDNRVVKVDIDGDVKDYDVLAIPVKQTIGQRLRLMLTQNQQA